MNYELAAISHGDWTSNRLQLLILFIGLLGYIGTASAQEASSPKALEEVIVTAEKRGAQSLQDVAITVQAMSGDEMRDRMATEIKDIAFAIPGLQLQDRGPGDREYILRGINSSGDSTVGVYYDEAVITASNGEDGGGRNAPIKLYDLERIEVLKGPQGTLYGANSMAGTIRFVTNKPKLDVMESYVDTRVSWTEDGGNNWIVNGMLNIPIIENQLAARVVAWLHDEDGYVDQIRIESGRLDDVNTEEVEGIRAHLRWQPTDDLTLTGSYTHQALDAGGTSRIMEGPSNDLSVIGIAPANAGPLDNLNNTGLTQDPWNDDLDIASLILEYDTGFGGLTATTNYFERDIVFRFDNTGVLAAVPFFAQFFPEPFQGIQPVSREIWSNEIRFASNLDGPVQFVAGGFFQDETQRWEAQAVNVTANGLPAGPFVPGTADDASSGGNTVFGRVDETDIEQWAAFGEVTWTFMDQFSLLAGGRWFNSEFDSVEFVTHPFSFTDVVPFVPNTNSGDLDEFTWKVTASWFPELASGTDLLVYFTASTGARRGGLNNASLPLEQFAVPEAFEPDELTNYEVGLKTTLLDGRLRANFAGYHMKWEDLQLEGIDELGVVNFIGNFGEADVDGVEAELTWQATDRLRLFTNWAYQDATLTEDTPIIGSPNAPRGLDGDRIPNVPEWQGSVSAIYEQRVFSDWTGQVRIDFAYRDSTQTEFNEDIPANIELDDYATLDVVLSLLNDSSGWRIDLFGDNLTDEPAEIDAVTSSVDQPAFLTIRPRTIGLGLRKTF